MILLAGDPAEAPLSLAAQAARDAGVDAVVLDETQADRWLVDLALTDGGWTGAVTTERGTVDLDAVAGCYLRLLGAHPSRAASAAATQRRTAAVALLSGWAELAAARVANRPSAMASNGSKPFQAALVAKAGFAVPEVMVSNDPASVRDFAARHGRVVFKSASGVRSVVRELTGERWRMLDRVRALPTQFQQLVIGRNVRVHVVADAVFACEAVGGALDYRYAEPGGAAATLRAVTLPGKVAQRCVQLAEHLGLPFAGVDLLEDHDETWWCFEVNPAPAYSCFEEPTGQPIAAALVRWLEHGSVGAT